MNARRRLQREIVRHRRSRPRLPTLTRITTPNGVHVRVERATYAAQLMWGPRYRASYHVRCAVVYGPWPPTPELLRELGRWA